MVVAAVAPVVGVVMAALASIPVVPVAAEDIMVTWLVGKALVSAVETATAVAVVEVLRRNYF